MLDVEVGTGADAFEAVAPNQRVDFILGPQGGGNIDGYHVWFALKVSGVLEAHGLPVDLQLLEPTTREILARNRQIVDLTPAGDGTWTVAGIAVRMSSCCADRNRPMLMHADVTELYRAEGTDERPIIGDHDCLDETLASICL
jgi:hypothetical protein